MTEQQKNEIVAEANRLFPDDAPEGRPWSGTNYTAAAMRHAFVRWYVYARRTAVNGQGLMPSRPGDA